MTVADFLAMMPLLLGGLGTTLALSIVAGIFGTLLGLLAAAARYSRIPVIAQAAVLYVEVFRGSPLLITLLFVYFGSSSLGIEINLFVAAVMGLSIYSGAFIGEIIRSGLEAVPVSQREAAQILGFNGLAAFTNVILPQTGRVIMPPLMGQYIALVKDSSLAFVIGLAELLRQGQAVIDRLGSPVIVYSAVAALYFIVCYPLSLWVRRLESKGKSA